MWFVMESVECRPSCSSSCPPVCIMDAFLVWSYPMSNSRPYVHTLVIKHFSTCVTDLDPLDETVTSMHHRVALYIENLLAIAFSSNGTMEIISCLPTIPTSFGTIRHQSRKPILWDWSICSESTIETQQALGSQLIRHIFAGIDAASSKIGKGNAYPRSQSCLIPHPMTGKAPTSIRTSFHEGNSSSLPKFILKPSYHINE